MNKHQSSTKQELLRRYLSGEVGPREEAELRALAREDDALADALAGIDGAPEADHIEALGRLRKQLPRRAAKTRPIGAWTLQRIAAAMVLLFAVGGALLYLPTALQNQDTAMSTNLEKLENPSKDEIATQDSSAPALSEANEEATARELESPSVSPGGDASSPNNYSITEEQEAPTSDEYLDGVALRDDAPTLDRVDAVDVSPPPPPPAPSDAEEDMIVLQDAINTELAPPTTAGGSAPSPREAGQNSERSRTQAQPSPVTAPAAETLSPAAYSLDADESVPLLISGTVTNEDDQVIEGATVRLIGNPIGELTNNNGFFSFEGDVSIRALVVEADGYEPFTFELPPNNRSLGRANLENDNGHKISLKRIATTDADALSLSSGTTIYPNELPSIVRVEGGTRALREGLIQNKPAGIGTGRVRISFKVEPNGSLTSFRLRGNAPALLQEYVKNYIQQNSVWTMISGEEATPISMTIRFDQ